MQDFYNTLTRYTARAYREDLKDFGKWFGETNGQSMAAELVTGVDLREYQAYMTTVRGLKPATVNRRLAAIMTWLKWAKSKGDILDLPHFPRRVKEPHGAPKSLSKTEEAAFLRAVERGSISRDKAMVSLMLYAGLRVGEAVRVQIDDIEISERKGRVRVRTGKGMKPREVPIGPSGRALIRPWLHEPKDTVWLFPGRQNHLGTRAAQDVIAKYAYIARLEGVTPHTLRHTFATRLLRSGVDIVTVSALMGHSRIDTTARYTLPSWVDLEKATEQWR